MPVPTLKLNNGQSLPVVGLGTYQAPDDEVEAVVKVAIDSGYRLIDTALIYGNEKGVGAGIKAKIQQGVVKREELIVTTKLWNIHHSVEDVVPACKTSLANLGLDYIDLYLVHWPFGMKSKGPAELPQKFDSFDPTSLEDTWREMEKCVELGLVKGIGISNFNKAQTQRILNIAKIKPVVNQVECHMLLNQRPLIEFCRSNGIVVEAYSPFIQGKTLPQGGNIFQEENIVRVAKTHNKNPGQIILRYLVDLGVVVIPKTVNPDRVGPNLNIFDFNLSPEETASLAKLDCHLRIVPFESAKDHPEYPFDDEF